MTIWYRNIHFLIAHSLKKNWKKIYLFYISKINFYMKIIYNTIKLSKILFYAFEDFYNVLESIIINNNEICEYFEIIGRYL